MNIVRFCGTVTKELHSSVPEPSSSLSLFVFGIIGLASVAKHTLTDKA